MQNEAGQSILSKEINEVTGAHVNTSAQKHLSQDDFPFTIVEFQKLCKRYSLFQLAFTCIAIVAILCFALFFSFLSNSFLMGISIAFFFFTFLSYFVLRLYFKEQKPYRSIQLRDEYLDSIRKSINYQEGVAEHHLQVANAAWQMASKLNNTEYRFYTLPEKFQTFTPLAEEFSFYMHWNDVHLFKELFLLASIDEHIKLVKCEPTNLETHAALANAYVMLSSHYITPKPQNMLDKSKFIKMHWKPSQKMLEEFEVKFRKTAQHAIEEFTILNEYAPNDPWVHAQLAYSYHDLEMPEKEIQEYEIIMSLCPDDMETLYKLGVLYFQQGQNAKGLRAYEILKKAHPERAEQLISYYGAYLTHDPYTAVLYE